MFKNQTTKINLSYNGPFESHQTAPLHYNQTVRNITLTQLLAWHEKTEFHEHSNTAPEDKKTG